MTAKQKKRRNRILITFVLFIVAILIEDSFLHSMGQTWMSLGCYLIPYVVIGYDVIKKALHNIKKGQIFDENFLMMIATFGAIAIGEYTEAVAVMLFYQVGELFQDVAVGRSRQSIADLMDICPEYANVEVDGKLTQVDPDDVEVGTTIVILPGERIPLDGIVVEGDSYIDTAALTGESVPKHVMVGIDVMSGCINGSGTLKVQVTKAFEDSTVSRILELVENASSRKAKVENFITRFARYYTPAVTAGAVLLAVIPPLVLGESFAPWLERACIFLVVSCPCALVISVPMGFFGGIGAASKNGILIKGSNFIEAAAELDTIVFDKTGTLTKGTFVVEQLLPVGSTNEAELLELAAYSECYSTHPIAKSIRDAYGKEIDVNEVGQVEELTGRGMKATLHGKTVLVGNEKLLEEHGVAFGRVTQAGTVVYVACDGQFAGALLIADARKEGAKEALRSLKKAGVKKLVMLTGDEASVAEAVANELGIDAYYAKLLPQDKVEKIEQLLAGRQSEKQKIAFVGDGINDAPVLTRADVGIAMGSMGSDAAIEAADIVLMDDRLEKLPKLLQISKKTIRIVRENIVFAIGVKFLVLILGALGIANMWIAVFADVGVAVLAILNSMRTLKD